MRILVIDYGTKWMGIVISDELQVIAQPVEFILVELFAEFLACLKELLCEKQVELIVVGMLRNMDGSYGLVVLKV